MLREVEGCDFQQTIQLYFQNRLFSIKEKKIDPRSVHNLLVGEKLTMLYKILVDTYAREETLMDNAATRLSEILFSLNSWKREVSSP